MTGRRFFDEQKHVERFLNGALTWIFVGVTSGTFIGCFLADMIEIAREKGMDSKSNEATNPTLFV